MLYITFPLLLVRLSLPAFHLSPPFRGAVGMDWGCFGLVWHGFVAFAKPLLGACPRARGRCDLTIRLVGWVVALWLAFGRRAWESMPVV